MSQQVAINNSFESRVVGLVAVKLLRVMKRGQKKVKMRKLANQRQSSRAANLAHRMYTGLLTTSFDSCTGTRKREAEKTFSPTKPESLRKEDGHLS